jgi:hypothetical protein
VGTNVTISATYPFTSALMMFFPGTKPTQFATYDLPAFSKQTIQF